MARAGPFVFLRKFRGLYDLDTLDTRFTTPSSVPYRTAIDARDDKKEVPETIDEDGYRGRWGTYEFYLYYVVLAWAIPYMLWSAYSVSRPSDPRYPKYQHRLSPGWVPGREIDNSDNQYHSFRENLLYMGLLVVFHPLCRRLWDAVYTSLSPARATPTPDEAADTRLHQRTTFDFCFALLYLIILHGFSAAKILFILSINYKIAKGLPRKYVPPATWIFNICVLFANELSDGYKFRSIAMFFTGTSPADLVSGMETSALVRAGAWMDGYSGLLSRWEILFNITILRLVSFNLDYYWSLDRRDASPIEKQLDSANLSERDRISIPAQPEDYCFRNYIGYAIYAPLYLTGPIMTFNDYIAQQRYRPATIETGRTMRYAVRFLFVLLAMELMLHFNYIGAIQKSDPDWSSYTAAQLSNLSFLNLHIIWLKLLLPWRFFRLWALVDGIDPPENMLRCVANNYSTLSFWRAWHRSYYRWLLRYIYIPLGGSSFDTWKKALRSVVTYLVVFTFVALWHDIKMRLLIWGWLIVFFFLPEIAAGYLFPRHKWESRPTAYRMMCCAGAVGNVMMMVSANLVGFAVGLDGLQSILRGIFSDFSGFLFLATACTVLFMGIQVMFEVRASELRKGIRLKC
ncbi:MBOAT, membrane-bound O-acyltransferase family-domain-containing protein [Cercophora scortea]|uniref:MBOAT, membrane-bound O-acyltransferase family-domain-containing protein n=1 Tax=Cercophora scortea TaxID=314031 RepID=A0AAE0J439_9PEZI|nr:MBOAT, membrane-bound O-acyltransferase family-domain-containing protein [Cercophora scortea]